MDYREIDQSNIDYWESVDYNVGVVDSSDDFDENSDDESDLKVLERQVQSFVQLPFQKVSSTY